MGVSIRLERIRQGSSLPAYNFVVRSKRGIKGNFLENIGSCRLFGSYKILYIKKDRLAYWLSLGAVCSERVLKELIKNGVNRA